MKKKLQQNKQPLSILLLLVTMAVILCIFLLRYSSVERAGCVQRLREYTQQTGRQIKDSVEYAQNYMNKISDMIYDAYQTSEETGRHRLSTLGALDMIARLELLMPDGTLYTSDGPTADPTLSFYDLAAQGTGVLPRSVDQRSFNRYVVRIFTPVRRDGKTAAILCGVVDLDRLAYLFPTSAYDGQIELHLVESRTGSSLIDPWHDIPGRLQDFTGYSFARGHSYEKLYEGLFNGRSGSTVLRSPINSEKCILYYTPVDFQDWSVMLSVKNSVAFAQANSVTFLFGFMVVLLVALSALFFVWFLWDVRQRQIRIDLRLQGARYMQSVQQTLFQAHTQPERFDAAMEAVAAYLAADVTVYFALEDDGRLVLRSVSGAADKAPPKYSDFAKLFPQTAKTVLDAGSFSSNRPFLWGDQDWQSARSIGMRNMMLVRLSAMDGKQVIGVLGAINTDVLWDDTAPLDQVALSFSMALENSKNYQTLAYMSQVDELTGIMNRNSYETRLDELDGVTGSVGCIYIDANGLHEINNHLGHDAGDEMLRAVADTLLANFNKKDLFRLGGDEFAVLSRGLSRQELESRAQKVSQMVEKLGYSVSLGLEWQEGDVQISSLVAAAEANMRQNKADYYANHGGERQMRNLNSRLEKTLAAKRDADSLLSYLAPNFLGVYFVDPQTDTYRCMVPSNHLKSSLQDAQSSFQEAMAAYVQEWVLPEYQQAFVDFCSYGALIQRLDSQGAQDLVYVRTDGQRIRLQVRRPSRAGDDQHEIMWIFTDAPEARR